MFTPKSKPIEETTTRDIWGAAFFGSLIGSGILAGSLFSTQPEWFLWGIRCFCVVWLAGWWCGIFRWRRRLADYQRQHRHP